MVICQRASKNEEGVPFVKQKKTKSENGGVTNRKASLFLSEVWQRNFEPILKLQNVQFQPCYRSPTTIPSNSKLLLLLLLRQC